MDSFSASDIIQILLLLGGIVTIYVKQQTKNKEFEMRLMTLENLLKKVEHQDDKIMEKLDCIGEDVNEIKVKLERKLDR